MNRNKIIDWIVVDESKFKTPSLTKDEINKLTKLYGDRIIVTPGGAVEMHFFVPTLKKPEHRKFNFNHSDKGYCVRGGFFEEFSPISHYRGWKTTRLHIQKDKNYGFATFDEMLNWFTKYWEKRWKDKEMAG